MVLNNRFILSYVATVGLVFGMTLRRISLNPNNAMANKFGWRAVILYAGGFLFLWIPEQVLCGNQLEHPPVGILNHRDFLVGLPVPLHAFFHYTSALGPYFWLAYAAETIYQEQKVSTSIQYPRR